MAVADFEVASIAEWAQYCSHRDFCEVFELSAGSRFDVRAQADAFVDGKKRAGLAQTEKFKVTITGLVAGDAAFVEVIESNGQSATAVPLVFLQEKPAVPSFISTALFSGEKPVFAAQHQGRTSVLTTQRALSFENGKTTGFVAVSDALISRHDGALVIHGNDSKGFATAVSFKGLYSPLSVERLLCGLKAAAMAASESARKPEEFAVNYFGASVESTLYNAVVQSPGASLSEISHETGLNRYLCRSVLRGLYLEGRVIPDKEGFWPAGARAQPVAAAADGYAQAFENAASEQSKPAASEEAIAALRSFEDLAQLCYRLLAKQKDLERQVDGLHAEVRVLSASDADVTELKLQMNRLEAELSAALRKLDNTDSEYQTNVKAMRENAKWAADKEAHLSWAHAVVSDKAQRKISEYKAYLSRRTKRSSVRSAVVKKKK